MKIRFKRVTTPKKCEECCKNAIQESCNNILPGHLIFSTCDEGDLAEPFTAADIDRIRAELLPSGIEVVVDRNSALIDRIEQVIIQGVKTIDTESGPNLFERLTTELPYQQDYLSRFYSKHSGRTLKSFILAMKVRRAKEMIERDVTITLSDIAFRLRFSSSAHLSKQFKNVAGESPSQYRRRILKRFKRASRKAAV